MIATDVNVVLAKLPSRVFFLNGFVFSLSVYSSLSYFNDPFLFIVVSHRRRRSAHEPNLLR